MRVSEMKRRTSMVKVIGTAVLICLATGLLCFLIGRLSADKVVKQQPDVVTMLSEIKELATMEYHYTDVAQFESSKEFYGMTLPFTTKKFLVSYDGVIKAGIDLDKARVSVDGNTVRVQLPPPEIFDSYIDSEGIRIYDEQASIFNPLKVEDFANFQEEQKSEMEAQAIENGLLTEARTRSEAVVQQMLRALLPEEYTLSLETVNGVGSRGAE